MPNSPREEGPAHKRISADILDFHHDWMKRLGDLPKDFHVIEQLCRRLFGIWERTEWLKRLAGDSTESPFETELLSFERSVAIGLYEIRQEIETLIKQARDQFNTTAAQVNSHTRAIQPDVRLCYLPAHEVVLSLVLQHMELIGGSERFLPPPVRISTGKASLSRVYHFHCGPGRQWVAKFDDENRADAEWDRIAELRRDTPDGVILPHADNSSGDGFILSEAATTGTSDDCQPLENYLRAKLSNSYGDCLAALDLTFTPLRAFHGKGRFTRGSNARLIWKDVFPLKPDEKGKTWEDKAREAAQAGWPMVDWTTTEATTPASQSSLVDRQFPIRSPLLTGTSTSRSS